MAYCNTLEIDLFKVLNENTVFEKVGLFNEFANIILATDEQKKLFLVYDNTVEALFEACRPEITQRQEEFRILKSLEFNLTGLLNTKSSTAFALKFGPQIKTERN